YKFGPRSKRLSRNLQEIAFVGNEVFLESALRQVLFQAFAEDQPVVFVECDQAAVEGGVVEAERQMPLRSWCKEPRPSCLLKPLKPLGEELTRRTEGFKAGKPYFAPLQGLQSLKQRAILDMENLPVQMDYAIGIYAENVGIVGGVMEPRHADSIGNRGMAALIAIRQDVNRIE